MAPSKTLVKPVVVRREPKARTITLFRLLPATLVSGAFHVLLIGMMFLFSSPHNTVPATERADGELPVQAETVPVDAPDPFNTIDDNPFGEDVDVDLNNQSQIKDKITVFGRDNPLDIPGFEGAKDGPPVTTPPPLGFSGWGQGVSKLADESGKGQVIGQERGGFDPRGLIMQKGFPGRSASTREWAVRVGGGTKESEAAVAHGLQWIARNQHPEGKWQLDGNYSDRGQANDVAGTAFGLLPLLAAGKTHKVGKDNPYDKPIEKALAFLRRRQDRRNGNLGGGMYAHGLATIALCEAYGMTQDPNLRRPAQMAVNYIVQSQDQAGGGWRYAPGQAGDTSVVGWQVMALKSAQMAGLDVPEATMRKAVHFLDSAVNTSNEGYGYVPGNPSTPTMSAVGLLLRQYLQAWGPQNLRMIKGIDNNLKPTPPGSTKNIYYYYYATQVMHHFGGQAWKEWNDKMRERLIAAQIKTGQDAGSWDSRGDTHGPAGGRLMQTSLSLLTLEVYYRHLPLYYRDAGQMASNPVTK